MEYDFRILKLFYHIMNRIQCKGLKKRLLLRGGISYGNAHFDKIRGIYLGYPLVEVAKGEGLQEWMGITLGISVFSRPIYLYSVYCIHEENFIPYKSHLKKNYIGENLISDFVLNWPKIWKNEFNDEDPIEILIELNTDKSKDKYYQNTIEFIRYSNANEKWNENIIPINIPKNLDYSISHDTHKSNYKSRIEGYSFIPMYSTAPSEDILPHGLPNNFRQKLESDLNIERTILVPTI